MECVNANKLDNGKGMEKKKKKKNGSNKSKTTMNLSTDPQSVAARERRHRISDRFKILQSMVPGGTKMDTASMLEEAINYVKFLKDVIWFHENVVINFADYHHHHEYQHDPLAYGSGQLPVPGSFPCFPESLALAHVPQQADALQASEPLALQDFNGFHGDESETLMHMDDGFMKY